MERKQGLILGGGVVLAAIALFVLTNNDVLTGSGGGGRESGNILGTGFNPSDIVNLPSDNFGGFPSPELLTLNQLLTPPPSIAGVTYIKKENVVTVTSDEAFNVGSSGSILNALIPTSPVKTGSFGETDYYVGKTLFGATVDIAFDKKANVATVTDPTRALTPLKFNLGTDLGQIFGLGTNQVIESKKLASSAPDAAMWVGKAPNALEQARYQAATFPAIVSESGDIYPYGYTSSKKATFTETGPAASNVYAIGGISSSRALDTAEQSMTAAKYEARGWTPPKSGPSVVLSKKGG